MPAKQVVISGRTFDAESTATRCEDPVVYFAFQIAGKAADEAFELCNRKRRGDGIVVDERRVVSFGFTKLLKSNVGEGYFMAEGIGMLPEVR